VGDLVKVLKDEEIPADLLLVKALKEVVYVSTMNLDGETNLKEKAVSLKEFFFDSAGELSCDLPNPDLNQWNGNLTLQAQKTLNCSMENMLLRGCTLKNSEYAYGIVVYVGQESKIFLNAKKPPRKISAVMRLMNIMLIMVLGFQIILVIAFASAGLGWNEQNKDNIGYTGGENESLNWFI